MSKKIIFGMDAKKSIKSGIDKVADAVKSTLGPCGNPVIIDGDFEGPDVSKDGVTVANSIILEDELENVGAKIIKKVSKKTADDVGDGTTTATIMAQSIINSGYDKLVSGYNPKLIKRGIDKAMNLAVEYIRKSSRPIDIESDQLLSIATISSNGDQECGKLISDVIKEVGRDGVVNIETSNTTETYTELVCGLRFDKGFLSNYFITDPKTQTCELDDPLIVVTDQRISSAVQIQKLLEAAAINHRSILIIGDNIDGDALAMLIINKLKGQLSVCAVKAPSFGNRKRSELEDIAAVVGATFITSEIGLELEDATVEHCGSADKVIITPNDTTIIGGKGGSRIDERVELIKSEIASETLDYNKKLLKERLAKLTNGIAILYVSATDEASLSEKKYRVDDALCATKAALEEGYVPGGAVTYLNAAVVLTKETQKDLSMSTPELFGYNLVVEALKAPLYNLLYNAFGDKELANRNLTQLFYLKSNDDKNELSGYDMENLSLTDNMLSLNIIDPAKVCRVALENAVSIVGIFLTTNCVIVDKPNKTDESSRI